MISSLLEQANIAALHNNWQLVNQSIQELLLLEEVESKKSAISTSLSPHLEEVVDLALQVLEGGDFNTRWDVAKLLPKLGIIAIAPLIEIIQDDETDWEIRWFAARILGEFDRPEVVTALVELLKSAEDEELAGMAAEALTNLGASAIAALTELLVVAETRVLAVRSLAQIRRSETIIPLLSVVDDPLPAVRAAAVEALSSFHDPRILPVLIEALKDVNAQVRKEAVIGLGLRSDLPAELDLINQLQPLLFDFNLEVCRQAAIALGRLGTDTAANALFQVLKSPHTPVSLQVDLVRALSWIQTAETLDYLQQILHAKFTGSRLNIDLLMVYQEIVTVLGRVEAQNLIPIAAQILTNIIKLEHPALENIAFKQSLAMALGELGDAVAIDSLINLLADPDPSVKLHAIAALKKLPNASQRLQQLATAENLTIELKQGVAIACKEWQSDR